MNRGNFIVFHGVSEAALFNVVLSHVPGDRFRFDPGDSSLVVAVEKRSCLGNVWDLQIVE